MSTATGTAPLPVTFLPTLQSADPLAAHWLRNVTLRLRREVSWLWRERGAAAPTDPATAVTLPPFSDRLEATLDLARHAGEKQRFFAEDETAAYLSGLIEEPPAVGRGTLIRRGSFGWVARELALSDAECFLLALALTPSVDSSAGSIFATCLNDPVRHAPTLALAQRLWDRPEEILPLANPGHPLFAHGLVYAPALAAASAWDLSLSTPVLVAHSLVHPAAAGLPAIFSLVAPASEPLPAEAAITVARLRTAPSGQIRLFPLVGPAGASLASHAARLANEADLLLVALRHPVSGAAAESWLGPTLTLAWLHGLVLYLGFDAVSTGGTDGHGAPAITLPFSALPVSVFVGLHDRTLLKRLPATPTQATLVIPPSTYAQRLDWWQDNLPGARSDPALEVAMAETSRRFRYEKETILSLCNDLRSLGRPVRADDLFQTCRADLDLGDLAQPVVARFKLDELMLPPKQARQLDEVIRAMRALTTVHYEWGTDRVWNESGLSALFSGPPGTGKTMCAEVIATELNLPLYRIDLSQVVNKYIGETEKNLRRLFDAAESSDVILFFDEADSLFGKRTEVKDAHDRYANLEVSYLLERMERFKGLAILATNRKKDLDEAFLRRLRFLIDFPLPGPAERLRMWKQAIPEGVDARELDFDFLAQRFPLAGGHIRSIVFHACLQTARPGAARKLDMPAVIAAVKREHDKLDRNISLEQYGAYAASAENLF